MAKKQPPHDWITVLLLVSLAPVSLFIGILVSFSSSVSRVVGHRGRLLPLRDQRSPKPPSFSKQRILISGSSLPALALARAFHSLGHTVVLTDAEPIPFIHHARCSRAVAEFIPFPRRQSFWARKKDPNEAISFAFPDHVVDIIRTRKIDVWIPCGVPAIEKQISHARNIVQVYTRCRVLYPDMTTARLAEDSLVFANYVDGLHSGIKVPGSFEVRSRGEIHRLLGPPPHRRNFTLSGSLVTQQRHVSFEDPVKETHWRGSELSESTSDSPVSEREEDPIQATDLIRLPPGNPDKTYGLLAATPISATAPRILSEVVEGKYCSVTALITGGTVTGFAAYMFPNILAYSRPVSPTGNQPQDSGNEQQLRRLGVKSPLHSALKEFTSIFASNLPEKTYASIRIRFILSESISNSGTERRLWTIGCSFKQPPYIATSPTVSHIWARSLVGSSTNTRSMTYNTADDGATLRTGIYSFPTDIYGLVMLPLLRLIILRESLADVGKSLQLLIERLLYWKEELFDWRDLGPWIWIWLVQIPIQAFVSMISGISVQVTIRKTKAAES